MRTFGAFPNLVWAFISPIVRTVNDATSFVRAGTAGKGPIGIGTGVAILLVLASCSDGSQPSEGTLAATFSYPPAVRRDDCDKKPGAAGASNGLSSPEGFQYNVRTPANLDPHYAHPLLMVYAPAGYSARQSEALTRLTTEATRRGFIVAYVGSRPLSLQTLIGLARIPKQVAASWCVDPNRVYATGHSDGGTVSIALALLKETKGTVAAIAPSAAGFSGKDLESFHCPAAIPVMIMHGKRDAHFPGWGKEAAQWWARCNACDLARPLVPGEDGCFSFGGCAPTGQTVYCEGSWSHDDWPPLTNRIVQFLESAGSP